MKWMGYEKGKPCEGEAVTTMDASMRRRCIHTFALRDKGDEMYIRADHVR